MYRDGCCSCLLSLFNGGGFGSRLGGSRCRLGGRSGGGGSDDQWEAGGKGGANEGGVVDHVVGGVGENLPLNCHLWIKSNLYNFLNL
jgi:hypothetical protein